VQDTLGTGGDAGGLDEALVWVACVWRSAAGARVPRGSGPRAGCAGARPRLGLPRDLMAADGEGRQAAGPVGAVGLRAACGIAGFLAVFLTDMVGAAN